MERRKFLSGAAAIGAVAAGTSAQAKPAAESLDHFAPAALEPEFKVDLSGQIERNPNQRTAMARCFGCFNQCGMRVRIDTKTDRVLRVSGNPYCETNNGAPLPLETPVKQALVALSAFQDRGHDARSTTCGRGSASFQGREDERRITQVLKRAGKRGEGQWKSISYEQALKEIVEGGNLFGEGHVKGLRELYRPTELAAPGAPEFGPATNRVCTSHLPDTSLRGGFYKRFWGQSWGTVNMGKKSAYCGGQQGLGSGMVFKDPLQGGAGSAIDFQNTEFAIFLGRSMGVSGYSLNSIGRKLAQARTDRGMKYLVVDPLLRATSVDLKDKNARWLPITPGGDVPFLFGLMHEIFSTETFRRAHLESPHAEAAKAVGELHYSNASHLVVRNPGHPLNNQFLRADVVGLGDAKTALVIDKASGQIASASASPAGSLFFKGTVKAKDGSSIAVESALSIFRAHVYAQPLDHYAQASGVSVADIKAVAKEFTSHGRKVAIERSTSVSYTDSYTAGYAVLLALVLVGAVDAKGGSVSFGGTHQGMKGPYTLGSFAGAKEAKSLGITINREGCYEQSSEFARKKAAGQNPYPSDQPWATVGRGLCNTAEMLVAHANASPYRLDAYFNWRANPLYMASALYHEVRESLHDPKRLGLYVAIDCFMTESVMPADYVIPDLHFLEEYAADRMWVTEMKGVAAAAPVVGPRTVKTAKGEHVSMERFVIDLGLALGLPGWGKDAITDAGGRKHDLFVPEDYYAKFLANIAADGQALPAISAEDREWSGVAYALDQLKGKISDAELAQVAYLLSRGGRYETRAQRYAGDFVAGVKPKETRFFNEKLCTIIHSHSGQACLGHAVYNLPRFWNGDPIEQHWPKSKWPLRFASYKPALRSPSSTALKTLVDLQAANCVHLHTADAQGLGIKTGDPVRVLTPAGRSALGTASVDDGVKQGAVVVSIGYGHRGWGASAITIDGKTLPAIKARGAGISANEMLPGDPTRKGASLLTDYYTGATVRHGTPVKVEKV